ncbi:TusE/DsrC/DsvC family sulfur relay protein [Gammaproteobacteria bacterium]|nr:TusE/DsrC/DsvC family sulfur relay protein [Gammaproteobacteria bacterium]
MINIIVEGHLIETNDQGFLINFEQWSESYANEMARNDNVHLFTDHWELIYYFRDYYLQNLESPTMHQMLMELTPNIKKFHNKKIYEHHIYNLFKTDPVHELCKLAGLPMPQPDT